MNQQCQTPAAVYSTAEAAFFCGKFDEKAHGTNAMTAQVLCDLCDSAPATIFCKNDDAKLCPSCDSQIHVSNPLAARHERVALSALSETQHSVCTGATLVSCSVPHSSSSGSLSDLQVQAVPEFGLEFEPAAKAFKDFDAFDLEGDLFDMGMGFDLGTLDMDFLSTPNKQENSDGVVPNMEQSSCCSSENDSISEADGCVLQSSSFSSADTFQVKPAASMPDAVAAMPAVPARPVQAAAKVWSATAAPLEVLHIGADVPMNREARVMRYRQKRARRTFQKTIRYQSRKAYAEIRPRIKGRFATREEVLALKAEQARQVASAAAPVVAY